MKRRKWWLKNEKDVVEDLHEGKECMRAPLNQPDSTGKDNSVPSSITNELPQNSNI